jgi:hypothetical protein
MTFVSQIPINPIAISDVTGLTAALAGKADVLTRKNALIIETDFYNTTSPFAQGLTGTAINSGTIVQIIGEPNHPGAVGLRDSTTINGGYRIMTGANVIRLAGGEKAVFVFQINTGRSTSQAFMGFIDNISSSAPVDGAFLFWTQGTGIVGAARSNNTQTQTASSFTPTNLTWYTAIIEVNSSATLVDFSIFNDAGTLLWTDTVGANIPTASGRETGFGALVTESSVDAGADILILDYMRMEINRTLTR